jgi:transcriptional regulator with XRE-family HTH domain
MPETMTRGTDLRRRLVGTGLRQGDVAKQLGMDESRLSRILNGRNSMPAGFPDRFAQAMRDAAEARSAELAAAAQQPNEEPATEEVPA